MVFAQRENLDIANDDHLFVVFVENGIVDHICEVLVGEKNHEAANYQQQTACTQR